MADISEWLWNEMKQTGKDYESLEEVALYDQSHAKFRDVKAESDRIIDFISAQADAEVLDIGCGTGAFLRRACGVGWRCTGIDVSEAMLAYAHEKNLAESCDIQLSKGGFLTFTEHVEHYDVVTSSFSLHHLPDFYKFMGLKNVSSLLKEDGVFFLQDVVIEAGDFIGNINNLVEHQYAAGGDFLREDVVQHFREEYSTFDWIMEGLLARAGFMIEKKKFEGGLLAWYLCRKISLDPDQSILPYLAS
jgi:2-polyprenyl-3-methyl-5-hydroxy-6-metoxy-1,4-benzoquinol methylase